MFRQIRIDDSQLNLQRIFWRESRQERLKEYQLCVVTYGMTSSAHNAVRSVIQCARDAKGRFPEAAAVIENDLYMDDCCSGGKTIRHAIKLAKEVNNVLLGAGFELRKWVSNSAELVKAMRSEKENSMMFINHEKASILGLKWLTEEDQFTFVVKTPEVDGQMTKRKIVSCAAQLYDPNGFIAPAHVPGKDFDSRFVAYWDNMG